jgi:putrescine transport system ATP-binding protein
MLAGFDVPSEGRILIDGADVSEVPPYERPVNMMFQSYALFPHMTVEDNVAFGLRQDGVPKAEREKRVIEALELVQMAAFRKRKPHQLSGGQRQRVALARTIVKRPKVLLLDEPLSALDKKLREQSQFELVNIQEKVGITFVMVTHDQEEAMSMSSRIAVMDKGRIVQVGTPSEIYEYPNSRFVADFIGSVNLFEGRLVEDESGHCVINSDAAGCAFHIGHGVSGTLGMTLWVALRPEKLRLSRPEGELGINQIDGIIHEIAYLGDISIYHIRLANGQMAKVTAPNLSRGSAREFTWDDAVRLSWASDAAVVLQR